MSSYRPPPPPRRRGWAVAALLAVTTVSALGMSIPNTVQPLIAAEFGSSMSSTQWVSLSYLLLSSLLMVPLGRLADSVGRVKVLLAGVAVFTVAALLTGFAPSLWSLAVGRGLMGTGGAAMTALPVALVRQTVPPNRVGRTMGILGSSTAVGWAAGPAVGGILGAALGWRWVFFILVPLGIGALVLSALYMPIRQGGTGLKMRGDTLGSAVLAVSLAAYSVGLTLRPFGLVGTTMFVAAGIVLLALFVVIELRVADPLVDFRLLGRIGVAPGLITAFFASIVMMTFTAVPPFYLALGLGLSPNHIGLAMAVGPTISILSGVPAGRLVEAFGARPIFLGGLGMLSIASVVFTILPPLFGLTGFLVSAVMLTPGNQMFMAGNNTAVMAQSGAEHQGVVAGVLNLSRSVGSITGVAVAAPLFDLAVDHIAGPAGATVGLQASFAVAALLAFTAFIIGLKGTRAAGIPDTGSDSED